MTIGNANDAFLSGTGGTVRMDMHDAMTNGPRRYIMVDSGSKMSSKASRLWPHLASIAVCIFVETASRYNLLLWRDFRVASCFHDARKIADPRFTPVGLRSNTPD